MSQSTNLYRRSSGIYVVRISIPLRFRRYAGQCEIHTSTGSYHLSDAKLLAVWHQVLIEYEQLDALTLNAAAPLTAGVGMISLAALSHAIELSSSHVIQNIIDRNIPIFWFAAKKKGFLSMI
ncbi:hypothetical protein ACCW76_04805 [Pantoea sp. C8B4]|uniref:hypothetical protein n=1 Tax=Pantoea sp. C8B4 TaxID=3243083 RepID=UPI003EDB56EF